MSNNGTTILAEQNQDFNINSLAAQRYLYSRAKNLFYLQLLVAVPLPILIAGLQVLFPEYTSPYMSIAAFFGFIGILSELILDGMISKLKKTAASIQELFDHNVLGIPWNKRLIKSKPDNEVVFRNFKRYTKRYSLSNLYDWYSLEIQPISSNLATVVCQRTNCTYDFNLRRRFNIVVVLTVAFTLFILLAAAASLKITVDVLIFNVLIPASPLFIVSVKQIRLNVESIENLKDLKEHLEDILDNATIDTVVEVSDIRQIQDSIYSNRVNSSLLPDFVFNLLRPALEEEMNFSAGALVKKL